MRQGAPSTWRPLGVSRSSAAGNRREEYVVPDRVGLCLFRQRAREPLLSLVSARGFKEMQQGLSCPLPLAQLRAAYTL